MTEDELYKLLRQVVITVTGVPTCIQANQNKPAPSGAYASIKVKQTVSQRGQANQTKIAVSGEQVQQIIKAQIIAECTVDFYRGTADDFAEKLKQCNKRSDISALLFTNNVGWNRTGPNNDLTALQSGNQEQRAQIAIFLMYETTDTVTINNILNVPIEIHDIINGEDELIESNALIIPDWILADGTWNNKGIWKGVEIWTSA